MRAESREEWIEKFLKNYRRIREAVEDTISERSERAAEYEETFEWFQKMMEGKDPDIAIQYVLRTSDNTERLLWLIDDALGKFAVEAKAEGYASWRIYDALYSVYFSNSKIPIKEIARKYQVKKSTIYKDVEMGKTRLGSILFGDDICGKVDNNVEN